MFDGDVPRGTSDRIDTVRAISVKGLPSQELVNHDRGVRIKISFKPQDERSDSWGALAAYPEELPRSSSGLVAKLVFLSLRDLQ